MPNREIRDIALALARLNQAMKSAGLDPVAAILISEADWDRFYYMPKSNDYMTSHDPLAICEGLRPAFTIAGVRFEVDRRSPP